MKILFSPKADWENNIRNGFQHSSHDITFAELSPENIAQYDLVIPLTITALEYLDGYRHLLVNNPVPIPALDVIRLCDDKLQLNQTLIHKGFGEFIPRMGEGQAYPYVLKKRQDVWGVNTHIISDTTKEQDFAGLIAQPEYFCQAFVPGCEEYTTHILFKNHAIACALNLKFTFHSDRPIKGKDKIVATFKEPCPYLRLFASILDAIGFEGLCCFNYKVVDGRPFIFEINPRFGGSLGSVFYLFADFLAKQAIE